MKIFKFQELLFVLLFFLSITTISCDATDQEVTSNSTSKSISFSLSYGKITITDAEKGQGTISNLPLGTTLEAFKADLTTALLPIKASYKIYEPDGTTLATTLSEGSLLVVTAEDQTTQITFNLSFFTPSNECLVTSEKYIISNNGNSLESIRNIDYDTTLVEFRKNIIISSEATYKIYEDRETMYLASNLDNGYYLKITAQNSVTSKLYLIILNSEIGEIRNFLELSDGSIEIYLPTIFEGKWATEWQQKEESTNYEKFELWVRGNYFYRIQYEKADNNNNTPLEYVYLVKASCSVGDASYYGGYEVDVAMNSMLKTPLEGANLSTTGGWNDPSLLDEDDATTYFQIETDPWVLKEAKDVKQNYINLLSINGIEPNEDGDIIQYYIIQKTKLDGVNNIILGKAFNVYHSGYSPDNRMSSYDYDHPFQEVETLLYEELDLDL